MTAYPYARQSLLAQGKPIELSGDTYINQAIPACTGKAIATIQKDMLSLRRLPGKEAHMVR